TGFSSVDVGKNKRSGHLFRHVQHYYDLAASDHIHIGDNAWSDHRVPAKMGITAILYQPKPLHQKRLQQEAIFTDKTAFLAEWRQATELAYNPPLTTISPELTTEEYKEIWSLGVASAPLWVGLCAWIAEQALAHELDRLLFLTREGEIFYQIYRAIFPDHRLNHLSLPPSEIMGISRQASFAASLSSLNMTEMNRSWASHRVQNLRGFFALFELDAANFTEILSEYNLNLDSIITNPMKDQNFAAFINHPIIQESANAAIARQKSLLIDYARQCGIKPGAKIGLVDIGWRGGIIDNLARILPDSKFYGLFLGLRRYINAQPENCQKFAYGLNENLGDSVRLFESFAALEALCQARAGSVIGYERIGDKIQPKRPVTLEEQIAYDRFTLPYQAGVIDAARIAARFLPENAVSSFDLKPAALAIWRQLQSSPPRRLAREILALPQQDIFGLGEVFRMADVPSLTTIILSPLRAQHRRTLYQFIRRAQWSSAIFAHRDISWPHRLLLFLVFKAANWLKILLLWCRSWYR
ncbi:MAG: hydrolase, partial [Alphaproteobacteria bacterium]|nr:hydrolase [Alphaproteobacteria bacterium]